MPKKNEKKSKLDKMLERRVDESMETPLTEEQMKEFIESSAGNHNNRIEIDFVCKVQLLPQHDWRFDEAIVRIHRKNADNPVWLHSNSDTLLDAFAYIGKADKPLPNTKSRAIWEFKAKESDPYHFSELENFLSVVIVNVAQVFGPDLSYIGTRYDDVKNFALLTWFNNGELEIAEVKDPRDVDTVKVFISDIVATGATVNDGFSLPKDKEYEKILPQAEAYWELLSKLDEAWNEAPLPSNSGDNNAPLSNAGTDSVVEALPTIADKDDDPSPATTTSEEKEGADAQE
jgi:hypothetical protein